MILWSLDVGPGKLVVSVAGGKIVADYSAPGVGAEVSASEDASGLIAGIEALLDAKFPGEKALIDGVSGILKSAIASIG